MRTTTPGQLLVNAVLPKELRDENRVLDKQGLTELLQEIGKRYPNRYREISHRLLQIGQRVAYRSGGHSFGPEHMTQTKSAVLARQKLRKHLDSLIDDDSLTDDARDTAIIRAVGKLQATQQDEIYQESLAEGNPLALQIASGSRGSPMNLASLRGSDLLYTDHRDQVLPVPVLKSYSQGLTPFEYWAGAYGARKGVIDLKFATQDAGFLSKQLNQIVHRSLVTALDRDKPAKTLRGLPVETDDDESEGSLLARGVAGYRRNTTITPKILQDLKRRGIKRILVRSPATDGPADGGVYARDAGVNETGTLPLLGVNVAMTAAQALSEPLTQAQISSKHSGGVAGAGAAAAISGFDFINQLIQTPKTFKGGAAHAIVDGLVQSVRPAPAGGNYVMIENKQHYVGKAHDVQVARGDRVEAGDVISDGVPNPATVVEHKGIGEGRRYFIKAFRKAFRDSNLTGHRRNIELLARGLINHVRLTDEMGEYVPDDIVPYHTLAASYKPRQGFATRHPKEAVGKYLERPYLHYSIGTKIRPSMLPDFQEFGVAKVDVHDDEPPFQPTMVRGMANLQHDPDWVTRMFGSGLKKGLLHGVHRGAVSDATGTSFVPGLARGVDFGRIGKVHAPQPHQAIPTMPKAAAGLTRPAARILEGDGRSPQIPRREYYPLNGPISSDELRWMRGQLAWLDENDKFRKDWSDTFGYATPFLPSPETLDSGWSAIPLTAMRWHPKTWAAMLAKDMGEARNGENAGRVHRYSMNTRPDVRPYQPGAIPPLNVDAVEPGTPGEVSNVVRRGGELTRPTLVSPERMLDPAEANPHTVLNEYVRVRKRGDYPSPQLLTAAMSAIHALQAKELEIAGWAKQNPDVAAELGVKPQYAIGPKDVWSGLDADQRLQVLQHGRKSLPHVADEPFNVSSIPGVRVRGNTGGESWLLSHAEDQANPDDLVMTPEEYNEFAKPLEAADRYKLLRTEAPLRLQMGTAHLSPNTLARVKAIRAHLLMLYKQGKLDHAQLTQGIGYLSKRLRNPADATAAQHPAMSLVDQFMATDQPVAREIADSLANQEEPPEEFLQYFQGPQPVPARQPVPAPKLTQPAQTAPGQANPQPAPPQPVPPPMPARPKPPVARAPQPAPTRLPQPAATTTPAFTRGMTGFGPQLASMAPGAVSQMLQGAGPAAIGAYGLLFNPGAALTLAAGPQGTNKPAKPLAQRAAPKLPKTPKIPGPLGAKQPKPMQQSALVQPKTMVPI